MENGEDNSWSGEKVGGVKENLTTTGIMFFPNL